MPQLIIKQSDGTSLTVDLQDTMTVGRHPDNMLYLEDESVSSHHGKIDIGVSGVVVADLFSTNGTYVNDEKIMVQQLKQGDRVRFGKVECTFAG